MNMYEPRNTTPRIAPKEIPYEHQKRWHDDNGHTRQGIANRPSLTIPFVGRRLTLCTWQQIVLVELDTRPRSRKLAIQILGEGEG